MALQLLKRNYVMQGYEKPKILKLPQGEMRWAPRRLPVDVGDVIMNMRMDNSKTVFVNESISKYAQGNNPYGEWGYPYKVNKKFVPPVIDPKFYQALSRMPVKFDAVTAGPIVKNLYEKKIEIAKVAPKTITDKICTPAQPNPCANIFTNHNNYKEGSINLRVKQPHASIPYHPSIPVHQNTGVPEIELDPKINIRPQMGIHFPFHITDHSIDVNNMRTPMHVAMNTPLKGSNASPVVNAPINLQPKVQTAAWFNPSYYLVDLEHENCENQKLKNNLHVAGSTNPRLNIEAGQHGNYEMVNTKVKEKDIHYGAFNSRASVPTIPTHHMYTNPKLSKEKKEKEFFFVKRDMPTITSPNHKTYSTNNTQSSIRSRRLQNGGINTQKTVLNPQHVNNTVNQNSKFTKVRI